MTLFVHHGPHLGPLADELADRLSRPPDDPFEPVVIAVPTAGVRDWLVRHFARRLGVTANITMPFPGRFLGAALGTPLDADDPWEVERLTWAVLGVLESGVVDVPGWSRATGASRSQRYLVARRLADLFDRYAANRPQVFQQWQNGAVGDGTVRAARSGSEDVETGDPLVGGLDPAMAWQFDLWRAVRERIGVPSPAERLPELVGRLRRGELEPALPSLVAMFGVGSVSPAQLDVIRALASVREVRLSAIHPSPVLWQRTAPLTAGPLVPRRRFAATATVSPDGGGADAGDNHPLLQSWGRLSSETAALLRGLEQPDPGNRAAAVATVIGAVPPTDHATSLLEHLQRDLLADRPPTPYVVDRAGLSVEVHACHGVTRQLEVLRDVLGHLFVNDPTLHPRDVLVVCPELERFEPFAKAVFARGSLPVPLSVSDLSLATENPVAAALSSIVATVGERCTTVDVLSVAGLDPVRHRLGIGIDDIGRFGSWADRLGTSWGLDTDHRSEWLDIDIEAGTWADSLRSLLLGAAMPAPEPRPAFADVVPYDDVGADDLLSAGRLAELIARLRRARHLMAGMRPIGQWCDVLVEILGLLCSTEPAEAWQISDVMHAVDALRQESVVAGVASAAPLDRADVLAILDGLVAGQPGRLHLRSGRVTMTGVVPVRNVPARVVCLLGFDEVSLRTAGVDGDDLLSLRPCVGERDRRAERRQLLLDVLMAAEQHLIVMCDGNDITTNRRVRFPVQLAELLDVVAATTAARSDWADSLVVVHHPRRAFDERNFRDGGIPGRVGVFGFDDTMRSAAQARRRATDREAHPTPLRWSIGGAIGPTVDLAELTEACTRPARTLLRAGLDVRLPGEVERQHTSIPLSVSALDSAGLGQRLLERYRAVAGDPAAAGEGWELLVRRAVNEWAASEALHPGTPPRHLIDQSLDSVADEVHQLVLAASSADPGLMNVDVISAAEAIDVDVVLRYTGRAVSVTIGADETRPSGALRLVDSVAGFSGSTICRLNYRRPRSRVIVGAALDLAAAVVATGRPGWRVLIVTRGDSGSAKPQCHVLDVAAGEPVKAATTLLETAAELRVAALRGAVPLFEETSRDLNDTGFIDEETLFGNGFVSGDMSDPDTKFLWGSVTTTEMLRLSPSPLFLARMLWGAVHWFATISKPAATQGRV